MQFRCILCNVIPCFSLNNLEIYYVRELFGVSSIWSKITQYWSINNCLIVSHRSNAQKNTTIALQSPTSSFELGTFCTVRHVKAWSAEQTTSAIAERPRDAHASWNPATATRLYVQKSHLKGLQYVNDREGQWRSLELPPFDRPYSLPVTCSNTSLPCIFSQILYLGL